jgi:hypothetical protein
VRIIENQRKILPFHKVEKLQEVLATSFSYFAPINGLKKAALQFTCDFKTFLLNVALEYHKAGLQVYFFDVGGGLVEYLDRNIPLQCSDYDLFLCIEDPGQWRYVHSLFFRCLERAAGLEFYDYGGLRTYKQKYTDFSVQIPLPRDKSLPCSLFQFGGLDGLFPSSFERPCHEHYALFTLPTTFQGVARSIDFMVYSKRENSCITSADCRRVDLCTLLFHPEEVRSQQRDVWSYTVDNYVFNTSVELLNRGYFDVQPREQALKIREGLRSYCKLLVKGLLPTSLLVEKTFCSGFASQYPEDRIKWELEISLGRYLHRHFKNDLRNQVLFLLVYADVISRSYETSGKTKESIEKILNNLLYDTALISSL